MLEQFQKSNINPILQAKPDSLKNIIVTFLIIFIIVGWFFGINEFPLAILALIAFSAMLKDDVYILLYEEKFIIRYSNYFGKILAIDIEFCYSDVKSFEYTIDDYSEFIKHKIMKNTVKFLIPSFNQSFSSTPDPNAYLKIEYYDNFKNLKKKSINFKYQGYLYAEALKIIKEKTDR